MNLLTDARAALVARLQTITVANGYRTNAGNNVRQGWFNEVLQSADMSFPVIVLQKAKGLDPVSGPGALKVYPGFSVVGAVSAGLDSYDDAIDDLELDLLRCLVPNFGLPLGWTPRGISGITVGSAEQFPPGSGERTASVLVPVHLHAIIRQ